MKKCNPSQAELTVREWVAEYGNKCTRKVLKALNMVFDPKKTTKIPKAVGKIEDTLVDVVLQYDLDQATIQSLFVAHDNRTAVRWMEPVPT